MRTSPVHYIAPSAVSIVANANNRESDIAVSIVRGTKIKVYCPRAGITATEEWTLAGRNRRLADATKKYTIYARLPKNDKSKGYLVFTPMTDYGSDVWVDKHRYLVPDTIDGLADLEGVFVSDNNWWVKLGEVSLPDANNQRTLTFDTGMLGTEQWNTEWNLNPDLLPLRVELGCTVNDEDAGPTPYVYWGRSAVVTATLTEGWTGTDIKRFDHWQIVRNTGNAEADDRWNHPDGAGSYRSLTDGSITLRHIRNVQDDFSGAVSSSFIIQAWGRDDAESDELVVLAEAGITILAETVEKYELKLSSAVMGYNPQTEPHYNPSNGIDVSIRATDQRGSVFMLTYEQLVSAGISGSYAAAGTDFPVQPNLIFANHGSSATVANIPVSAFAGQKNLNVRLQNADGKELSTGTIAFVRDGVDSKEREWIFLRSQNEISFGDASSAHPAPKYISGGQVNPAGAATGEDTEKNQDEWVPQGWWDEAQGTDATNLYEYCSYRDYNHESNQWGDFTTPHIWSHYGKDGNGIVSITRTYAISAHGTSISDSMPPQDLYPYNARQWESGSKAPTADKPYLWVREATVFNDSSKNSVKYYCIGKMGADGNGIVSITRTYAISAYGTSADDNTPPSDVTSWGNAIPDTTQAKPYIWEKEVTVWKDTASNTTKYYCIGKNGNDALNVIVTPAAIIVNQSLSNTANLSNLENDAAARAVIAVFKGGMQMTGTAVTITSASHCTAQGGSNYMQLKAIEKSGADYYDTGYVICSVSYLDNGTEKTVSDIRVNFYANLLGSWKETVIGDVKRAVATKTYYVYDEDGNVVGQQTIGDYIRSSSQNTARLEQRNTFISKMGIPFTSITGESVRLPAGIYTIHFRTDTDELPSGEYRVTISRVVPGESAPEQVYHYEGSDAQVDEEFTVTAVGDYFIVAEDSLSTGSGTFMEFYIQQKNVPYSEFTQTTESITARVSDNEGSISQLQLTANGLTSEVVNLKNGKNLLTGVLTGNGWTDDTGAAAEISDDYVMHTEESELWSPDVDNGEHRTRTLTFYSLPNIATQMNEVVEIHGRSVTYASYVGVISGDTIPVGADTYVRYQFEVESQDDEYSLHIVPTLMSPYVLFPQLEDGEDATVFDAGGREISSRIKQTADGIAIEVGKAGIDINREEINLKAGKVNFLDQEGNANPKISIDPATGTLNAVDGNFDGRLHVKQLYSAAKRIAIDKEDGVVKAFIYQAGTSEIEREVELSPINIGSLTYYEFIPIVGDLGQYNSIEANYNTYIDMQYFGESQLGLEMTFVNIVTDSTAGTTQNGKLRIKVPSILYGMNPNGTVSLSGNIIETQSHCPVRMMIGDEGWYILFGFFSKQN